MAATHDGAKKSAPKNRRLVGLWFQEVGEDGTTITGQGQVLSKAAKGFYLVRLDPREDQGHSDGAVSALRLVSVETLAGWHLYADNDDIEKALRRYNQSQQTE